MLVIFVVVDFGVNDVLFLLAMSALAGFAGWEWSRLSGVACPPHQYAFAGLCALLCFVPVVSLPVLVMLPVVVKVWSLLAVLFWLGVALLFYLAPEKNTSTGTIDYTNLLIGAFLLGSCVYFSHLLHADSQGGSAYLFLYVMCTVWVMDIGAYFTGKRFGKHKLAPKISPGKTWEGVIGGLLCTFVLACAVLLLAEFAAQQKLAFIVGTGFAAAASILGDLFESRMKRSVGIKDSSQLIPGHGGVLDRIDGVIAAVPVFSFAWVWF